MIYSGETKAEKAARKAAKAAKKAAKKNNNNAAPAPTTAPAVAQSDNTITLEECDETVTSQTRFFFK